MTGIDSWSGTPATNATADGGSINWAEGQAPSTVNNTARQMCADVRARTNDLIWFQYGTGDQGSGNLAVPSVYSSGTAFTITGADVTTIYHAGRRVRAVGVATGTIYGTIASSSYSAPTTTVNMTWDSGSLSNETLVISLSQIPLTGDPMPAGGFSGVLPANNGGTGIANNASSTVTISGSFATTLTVTGITGVTLPTTGTLSTLAGAEELTNKTLNASVGKGTWTASGTWTLPAVTLGGAITYGGVTLSNSVQGTGSMVLSTNAALTTPNIGVATATSVNGMTITASTGTFTLTNGKTFAVTHGLTLSGTDSTVMTFPSTSATIARTDAANTFTGTQTFSNAIAYGGVTLSASVVGTGAMVLATAPTFASTIKATTGIAVGGATPGAGGVAFPATAVAVADANTLDDYEEGTWTPGVSFGAATTGITYGSQSGTYIKIGKLVFLSASFTLTSKGSATGSARVTGLPFTLGADASGSINGSAALSSVTSNLQLGTYATGTGVTTLDVLQNGATGASAFLTDANFANNTNLYFNVVYQASA